MAAKKRKGSGGGSGLHWVLYTLVIAAGAYGGLQARHFLGADGELPAHGRQASARLVPAHAENGPDHPAVRHPESHAAPSSTKAHHPRPLKPQPRDDDEGVAGKPATAAAGAGAPTTPT